jgi:hypothetical protein
MRVGKLMEAQFAPAQLAVGRSSFGARPPAAGQAPGGQLCVKNHGLFLSNKSRWRASFGSACELSAELCT